MSLSKKQQQVFDHVLSGRSLFFTGDAGTGKCLRNGTPVIFYNGKVQPVENVRPGDQLMGDDDIPRTVLSITSGTDTMYQIDQLKGDSYVVNSQHILSLVLSYEFVEHWSESEQRWRLYWFENFDLKVKNFNVRRPGKRSRDDSHDTKQDAKNELDNFRAAVVNRNHKGDICDISILDYLAKSARWRNAFKGYKRGQVDWWPERHQQLDPYMMGYWLGDGLTSGAVITSQDATVLRYFAYEISNLGPLWLQYRSGYNYAITSGSRGINTFKDLLRLYEVLGDKHVPDDYKYASVRQRLELLAGFLDADGHLAQGNHFEYCQKKRVVFDDIIFIARSLGFMVQEGKTRVIDGVTYYRANIWGAIDTIPTKIPRKRARAYGHSKELLSYAINVKKLDNQLYSGFTLDGNSRFCLGDFTVTHNSHLLQNLIKVLPLSSTFVTAMTGAAATKICGTTFHSWAGIGLGNGTASDLLSKLGRQGRWNITIAKILIIDEVSMLCAELFDKVEWIARQVRGDDRPFGGIQMVLCGDFYQIPPVNKKLRHDDADVKMLFESERFSECVPHIIELDVIFRQRDTRLIDMLNDVRYNRCKDTTIELLDELKRPLEFDDGILPTRLHCKNIDVDRQNSEELKRLPEPEVTYDAEDDGVEPYKTQLDTHSIWPRTLKLRVGAQVMHLVNDKDDRRLVNGSRGYVKGFVNGLPLVQFASCERVIERQIHKLEDRKGTTLASRCQLPIKLAWSITVHKAQGMSIDRLEVKIDDAFDYGIAYVALSRATNIEGLRVLAYDARKFRVNPKVQKFYRMIRSTQCEEKEE